MRIYPRNTMLYLGATDNSSGVKKIVYSVNNGPKQVYKTLLPFPKTGEYVIEIQAIDHIGNTTDGELRFLVRNIQAGESNQQVSMIKSVPTIRGNQQLTMKETGF